MSNHVEELSDWYLKNLLELDNKLIYYRYKTTKAHFVGKTALEMGPSTGVMTTKLVDDFEQLDLVDGSSTLLDTIPEYPNVRKFCSLFETFEPEIKYDTIIMDHVLEHLESPVEVLQKIKSWLKPEGVFIVGVPNAKSFHRLAAVKMGLLKSEYELNSRDIALGHHRVYDMESLQKDLTEGGFNIEQTGGVFLKPLSNGQIQRDWTDEMIEGFYQLGFDYPASCAEIYAVCKV